MIDCHTHAFPMEAMKSPLAWATTMGENHWLQLVAPMEQKSSLQGWATCDDFLRDMDRNKIDKSVLLGWYWEKPATCRVHNRYMATWLKKHPDRFIALASVHPADPNPRQLFQEIVDQGFRGFGELCPQVQGSSWKDNFWHELAQWAAGHSFALSIHVTETVGRHHAGAIPTPLDELVTFASSHLRVPMILAHWGGGLLFYELNPYIRKKITNVYYDSAASPLLYDRKVFDLARELVGDGKILMGSDYPLRLFPGKECQPDRFHFLNQLKEMEWTSISHPDFFHNNAAAIFS